MNKTTIGFSLAGGVAVAALVAGAYRVGVEHAPAPESATEAPVAAAPQPQVMPGAPAGRWHEGLPGSAIHPKIAGLPAEAPAAGGPAVATSSSGLRFTHFRVGNRNVKTMLADGNLLWVGTSGGVVRYDRSKDDYRLFDVRSGLLSNGIFHLSKLGGRVVVGTYGGGLSLYDPAADRWQNYNIQHGLADAFVYDALQLENGDVWIATWSGANLVHGGKFDDRSQWETFTVENTGGGLPNDWVYGLARGHDGEVWMATEGGLARYRDGQWSHWTHAEGLGAPYELVKGQIDFTRDPAKESSHHARQKVEQGLLGVDVAYNPNYIVALAVDATGNVWAGTWGGGLARFDGASWHNYTVADGLPANHVFMLHGNDDGSLWVGTSKGLARFDGTSFRVLTTADGLLTDNVFSLARDEDDGLWVGGYGGVARLKGYESLF